MAGVKNWAAGQFGSRPTLTLGPTLTLQSNHVTRHVQLVVPSFVSRGPPRMSRAARCMSRDMQRHESHSAPVVVLPLHCRRDPEPPRDRGNVKKGEVIANFAITPRE